MTERKRGHQREDGGGIVATFKQLVLARPDRKATGFAPGGRVATHQFGTNRSVFRGRGMEFDESRIYQHGDDMRSIDWRVTARTGTLHTKLFHEERERPVLILADLGPSMRFGTRVRFKSVLAAEIAAQLAWVGLDGGDRVGGFIVTADGVKTQPMSRSSASLLQFLKALAEATAEEVPEGDVPDVPLDVTLDRLRQVSRPGTLVFVISDFAAFDEKAERALRRLSLHAHVTNILVYDQLDTMLPAGRQRISDGLEAVALGALSKKQLDDYAKGFADRRERIERLCQTRGMAFHAMATSDDPRAVLQPHQRRARRPATSTRMAA